MVAAPVEVFRLACIEAKIEPLQSMDGPQPAAVAAKIAYEQIVRQRIEAHSWPFAKWQEPLVAAGGTVPLPWLYWYVKPASIIIMHGVVDANGRRIAAEVRENKILTKEDDANVIATWRPPESIWPPSFTQTIVLELAAVLRKAVKKDDAGAESARAEAELRGRQSMVRQKRQNSPRRMFNSSLVRTFQGTDGQKTDPPTDV